MNGAPDLYIITDRHATAGRPLPSVIARALAGGAAAIRAGARVAVQLREKDLPTRPLLSLARELRAITTAAGAELYINDRVDIALAIGADGVHLGGRSLTAADVAAVAPALAVALSVHDPTQAAAAARNLNVRFAVYGPVYATPGKGSPTGLAGPGGLTAACAAAARPSPSGAINPVATLPLLALGGVDPARVPECRAAGAAGVACIRAVISATNPDQIVNEFMFSRPN